MRKSQVYVDARGATDSAQAIATKAGAAVKKELVEQIWHMVQHRSLTTPAALNPGYR